MHLIALFAAVAAFVPLTSAIQAERIPSFNITSCNASESFTLQKALHLVQSKLTLLFEIEANVTQQPRVERFRRDWFGNLSPNDDEYVTGVLHRMYDRNSLVQFLCASGNQQELQSCASSPSAQAFVDPSNPETIVLCPQKGDNPKVGSFHWANTHLLMHELTHTGAVGHPHQIADIVSTWEGLASRDTRAYSHMAARSLAKQSPRAAVLNADNYALYVLQLAQEYHPPLRARAPSREETRYHRFQIQPADVDAWPLRYCHGRRWLPCWSTSQVLFMYDLNSWQNLEVHLWNAFHFCVETILLVLICIAR